MKWIYLLAAPVAALLSLAITVGAAPRASADLIFDQTVDLTYNLSVSDFVDGQQSADIFHLQSGASTITDVHWWGAYSLNFPETDDFTIRIFADLSGAPEIDPLNEFVVGAVNRVDTGVDFFPDPDFSDFHFDIFAYSVDIAPLTLAANTTYWLSIVNDTPDIFNPWLWNYAPTDRVGNHAVRHGEGQAWFSSTVGHDFGFQLTNDAVAVPEPATWAMFAAGLAGLGWVTRRRKAG